jgi:phosphoribosylamine---glycine ligase
MASESVPSGPINILLIGGGAREHALAWKLKQSPRCGTLYVSDPQNPGLAALGTPVDVPVDVKQAYRVQSFCEKKSIGLVVIGPEEPLAQGMADALLAPGRVVFGPVAAAARLEADKAWCKTLLRQASIPTGDGRIFTDAEHARAYVESRVSDEPLLTALRESSMAYRDPVDRRKFIQRSIETDKAVQAVYRKRHDDLPVIKASGLAKGKGVILPSTLLEALDAIERIMVKLEFGEAGRTVLIEERLEGREVSVLALVDGRNIFVLEPCLDHKRLGDNDTGPNTGGMGVVCPGGLNVALGPDGAPGPDEALLKQIEAEILVPSLDAMRRDGIDYRGVLYAGIMLTAAGPKVLEFNCRFGDPECQALLTRLDCDLVDVMLAIGSHTLDEVDLRWSPAASCCVVLAAAGYPAKPVANTPITGLDDAAKLPGVQIFHAGTRRDEQGRIVTAGGRVLSVTASGSSPREARERAYAAVKKIHFEGMQVRTDIGLGAQPVLA